jgi:hypothetical protein
MCDIMGELTNKIKETLKGAKDTAVMTGEKAADTLKETTTTDVEGTQGGSTDPLTEYESKEPMTPAKIQEHEPTAVKREMTEKITEPGQSGTNPEEAAEKARKSGMTKGTDSSANTGNESVPTNKRIVQYSLKFQTKAC